MSSDSSRDDRRKRRRRSDEDSAKKDADGHSSDSSSSLSSRHKRRRHKHHKKKHKKRRKHHHHKYSSDEEVSSDPSSSVSTDSRHRRHKHHKKKHKHRHHHHKKHHKKSKKDEPKRKEFGAYGYIQASELPKYERVLHVWLEECKGIPSQQPLSKRDLQNYFNEFREDFHTCTMPHEKFYNYEAWEQAEHQKQQQKQTSSRLTDEQLHAQSHQAHLANTVQLDRNQVLEMKHQQELRAQMQYAFKSGDTETYQRLKDRLSGDPDARK